MARRRRLSRSAPTPAEPKRLAGLRRRARWVLLFERLWPALWPPAGILGLYLAAALLDLPQRLGTGPNTLIVILAVVAALGAFGWSLRRFRWPSAAEAEARLRRDSGLFHDPFAVLRDRPAHIDPVASILWRAHEARSRKALAGMRLAWPRPGLARRDRYALRAALAVALVAACVVAGPAIPRRLERAASLDFAFLDFAGPPPAVTAWITPPAYTGRPPILLAAQSDITVPAGSRLTVTVSGARRRPSLRAEDDPLADFLPLADGVWRGEAVLVRSGLLALRADGGRVARWPVSVQPDMPPMIAFAAPPTPDPADPAVLRLPWRAVDDYGIVRIQLRVQLADRPDLAPMQVAVGLSDHAGATATGQQSLDFSNNSWSGLPATMRLIAWDGADQRGQSPTIAVTLPERTFHDPLAARAAALRRQLMDDPRQAAPIGIATLGLGAAAAAAGRPPAVTLPLAAAAWALDRVRDVAQTGRIADMLWEAALHLEQGQAADTARSLRDAEAALRQAVQAKNASPEALQRAIAAVQAAILQHLSALMQMAQHQGGEVTTPADAKPLDLSAFARAMRRMQAAAKAGDAQAMRDQLAQLEQSLHSLEQARVEPANPAQEAARRQAQKDLAGMQDMLRRQSGLLDRATGRAETETPNAPASRKDAAAQEALRAALRGMIAGGRKDPALGAAAEAMRRATHDLQAVQDGPAAGAQAEAIRGLQQAAGRLSRAMAAAGRSMTIGEGNGGAPGGEGQAFGDQPGGADTDPFGRMLQAGGGLSPAGEQQLTPGTPAAQLRAILDDLRHRAGELDRSQSERDYIERLLQPF